MRAVTREPKSSAHTLACTRPRAKFKTSQRSPTHPNCLVVFEKRKSTLGTTDGGEIPRALVFLKLYPKIRRARSGVTSHLISVHNELYRMHNELVKLGRFHLAGSHRVRIERVHTRAYTYIYAAGEIKARARDSWAMRASTSFAKTF